MYLWLEPSHCRLREGAKACTHLGAERGCVAGRWAERCHNVPSPLVGEGQGEGCSSAAFGSYPRSDKSHHAAVRRFPVGRSLVFSALWPPLSLSLPHKGGGNHVARTFAPHTICPASRDVCIR